MRGISSACPYSSGPIRDRGGYSQGRICGFASSGASTNSSLAVTKMLSSATRTRRHLRCRRDRPAAQASCCRLHKFLRPHRIPQSLPEAESKSGQSTQRTHQRSHTDPHTPPSPRASRNGVSYRIPRSANVIYPNVTGLDCIQLSRISKRSLWFDQVRSHRSRVRASGYVRRKLTNRQRLVVGPGSRCGVKLLQTTPILKCELRRSAQTKRQTLED